MNAKLHTFYRVDGSEIRVRAVVEVPPLPAVEDFAIVSVTPAAHKKLLSAGPLTWGNGRFAPVTVYQPISK